MSAQLGTKAYIALGANLGEPLKQMDNAVSALNQAKEVLCLALSPVYSSVPHGGVKQPDYHNAVLVVKTTLPPMQLLLLMQSIENDNGRERQIRWGARTLDLDLILYGNTIQNNPQLIIPHPRAHKREFVIKPLYDLDKNLLIPNEGAVAGLLKTLPLNNLTEVRHGITYHD